MRNANREPLISSPEDIMEDEFEQRLLQPILNQKGGFSHTKITAMEEAVKETIEDLQRKFREEGNSWTRNRGRYKLKINRHREFGSLCGYVGVMRGHPMWGKTYQDDEVDLRCHGGITYSASCFPMERDNQTQDYWVFGFDTAHAGDLNLVGIKPMYEMYKQNKDPSCLMLATNHVPKLNKNNLFGGEVYRDMVYVKKEVKSLYKQLKALEKTKT